jgi:hypothetical protein
MFNHRGLVDWIARFKSKDIATQKAADGPETILRYFQNRVPKYLEDTDQGKLIYPACNRKRSDACGDIGTVWIIRDSKPCAM